MRRKTEGLEETSNVQIEQPSQESLIEPLATLVVEFGPLQRTIGTHVWTTELDRFLILRVHHRGETKIWVRLIGPTHNLNLQLNTPDPSSSEGIMDVTTESIPERREDLIEARIATRGCMFADVYVVLRQFGLDEWTFVPESSARDKIVGAMSWT